jgi:hypothetical protein
MRHLRMQTIVSCGLLVIALLAAGCGGGLKAGADEETRQVLDDAITQLANQSKDWQRVLTDTRDKLPKEAQSFVRVELNDLVSKTVQAAGSEVRCIVDFLGQRALEGLLRLRAQLLGQEAPPRQPIVCGVTPSLVRMAERNQDPSRFEAVQVYGYNFDTQPTMQILLTDNNIVRDVTKTGTVSNLTYQTHYQMTLNLGGNGVKLTATSQVIALAWNGARVTEIPIVQPEPPPCRVDTVYLDDIGEREVRARLVAGDAEFGVNRPWVTAGVNLTNRESHVDARLWIDAVEARNGDTHGYGDGVFTIYSAPSNWRVLRIVTPTSDSIDTYRDETWEVDPFDRAGNGPVSRFDVWGDTDGADVEPNRDDGTRVHANFRRVQLEIVQTANCR